MKKSNSIELWYDSIVASNIRIEIKSKIHAHQIFTVQHILSIKYFVCCFIILHSIMYYGIVSFLYCIGQFGNNNSTVWYGYLEKVQQVWWVFSLFKWNNVICACNQIQQEFKKIRLVKEVDKLDLCVSNLEQKIESNIRTVLSEK